MTSRFFEAMAKLGPRTPVIAFPDGGDHDLAMLHPGRFCAVGGHSPALWFDGGETAPGAFDSAETSPQRRHRGGKGPIPMPSAVSQYGTTTAAQTRFGSTARASSTRCGQTEATSERTRGPALTVAIAGTDIGRHICTSTPTRWRATSGVSVQGTRRAAFPVAVPVPSSLARPR